MKNEFLRYRQNCLLGIKAYQNIRASLFSFRRLYDLVTSKDYLLISSFFYMGVIRYAKPFLESKICGIKIRYPIKHIKNIPGFSIETHQHLIKIRDTLIAHDDFDEIEPHILSECMRVHEVDIPMLMLISNKCIAYPVDIDSTEKICKHVEIVYKHVANKLSEDMEKLRDLSILYPEQANAAEKYSKDYGESYIPKGGKHIELPNCEQDDWLNIQTPNFSDVHNGYCYETVKLKKEFKRSETIELPDGYKVEIKSGD